MLSALLIGAPAFAATARPLNDSGIVFCAGTVASSNGSCDAEAVPGQDAHHGRDALAAAGRLTKTGGGHAGFDFSKISNSGKPLPADAALGLGPEEWACTRDNVTGLIWEVKLDDPGHLRHREHAYTWQYPGGVEARTGGRGRLRSCRSTLGNCNSERFVQAVNAAQLCGANDWRMPSLQELESIINYGQSNPAIDSQYFPNAPALPYWTSTPLAQDFNKTWIINFADGYVGFYYRFFTAQLRLVRSDQ